MNINITFTMYTDNQKTLTVVSNENEISNFTIYKDSGEKLLTSDKFNELFNCLEEFSEIADDITFSIDKVEIDSRYYSDYINWHLKEGFNMNDAISFTDRSIDIYMDTLTGGEKDRSMDYSEFIEGYMNIAQLANDNYYLSEFVYSDMFDIKEEFKEDLAYMF